MSDEGLDWTGVTEKMARQILAQGETYLQTQVQLAIAADQRATTAASIFASMGTAVAAAFIAFWDKSNNLPALFGGLAGAGCLLLAAGFAFWAARPTAFDAPGNHPKEWFDNRKSDLVSMIGGECENYQTRITYNESVLAANKNWISVAFGAATVAPVASVITWLVFRCYFFVV